MFGFLDQSLRASEQMVSRTKEVAFMVPFVMVNSTYYVSGALTGVTVGVVTTAADVIGTLLWDSDSIKLEIELTAEDLRSIASDAGLDFTLCPSPASQPQTPQLSHANSKADLLEEEPSSLKMKSYDVLQQELHSSKQALISAQGSLAEAEQKAMQESQDLHAEIVTQSSSLKALQELFETMQAEKKTTAEENKRLAQEVVRLEKLNMAGRQEDHDMWAPHDLGIQQLKANVPASPRSPLQYPYPRTRVADNDCSSSSPGSGTSSDNNNTMSLRSELAEDMAEQQLERDRQLAQLQQEVKKWQDESLMLNDSLEETTERLEEALQREQGLQSSLTSLQFHLDKHANLLTFPTSCLDADWVIGPELGHGANASVLAASHPYLPGIVLKKGHLDSLEDEAHKMWLAQHPSLVRMYCKVSTSEKDPSDGSPLVHLGLEGLDRTLASMLKSGKRFTVREQVVLLQQVAAGLTHLHFKGIVHQDLHSDNVLQALDGLQYKVSDLGNAAFHEIDGQPNVLPRNMCGLGIESPQLATDILLDGEYQPLYSSDVWAFGLLALDLIGGSMPAQHSKLMEEYLEEVRRREDKPTTSLAQTKLFTYLMDLAADEPPEDYALQIKLPPIASGPEAQAATDLQAVIQGCLHSYEGKRLGAYDIQKQLFQILVRQGWTNQATRPSKRRKKAGKTVA